MLFRSESAMSVLQHLGTHLSAKVPVAQPHLAVAGFGSFTAGPQPEHTAASVPVWVPDRSIEPFVPMMQIGPLSVNTHVLESSHAHLVTTLSHTFFVIFLPEAAAALANLANSSPSAFSSILSITASCDVKPTMAVAQMMIARTAMNEMYSLVFFFLDSTSSGVGLTFTAITCTPQPPTMAMRIPMTRVMMDAALPYSPLTSSFSHTPAAIITSASTKMMTLKMLRNLVRMTWNVRILNAHSTQKNCRKITTPALIATGLKYSPASES